MAWKIEKRGDRWHWSWVNTGYGAAVGDEDSLARAKVELYIAQCELMEHPLPPMAVEAIRADPERFAADYPDSPEELL